MLAELQPREVENCASRASSRRSGSPKLMYWIRRIHLYLGLFMFPWVMLYGFTALLFNHAGLFPDRPGRTLTRDDFLGTALEQMTDPAADAEQAVAALNAKFGSPGQSTPLFRLVTPEKAVYSRDVIVARARGTGQEHSVLYDLPSGTAFVSTSEQAEAEQPPFAMRGLKVPGALGERLKAGLPQALIRQGLAADDASISIGAELLFLVEADGRIWRASYNPQTGAVSGRPVDIDQTSDLSARRFLTQLHLTHGYPSQAGIKWLWAVVVDCMFASMIFWGISGLFMWWQIKSVRAVGAVVLSISLILAAVLAFGMHRLLAPL
jgi:hypothetical protein